MKRFKNFLALMPLLVAATIVLLLSGSALPSLAAPAIQTLNSENYAGYASLSRGSHATKFSQVTGSWRIPAIKCHSSKDGMAIWVGIDGIHANDLEQTGTLSTCDKSLHAQYFAFFEIVPDHSGAHAINRPVSPGDLMNATVNYVGKGAFNLLLSDASQGWSVVNQVHSNKAPRNSAECIVEAISDLSGHILPLAKFGSVTVSHCRANGKPINAGSSTARIELFNPSSGKLRASLSGLFAGGTAFTVEWKHS